VRSLLLLILKKSNKAAEVENKDGNKAKETSQIKKKRILWWIRIETAYAEEFARTKMQMYLYEIFPTLFL
jgi:hypothetical protein